MGLARCILVHCGVIYNTAGTPIWFGGYDHPAAPTNRVIYWNFLKDTKLAVTVQTFLDIFLPVQRNLAGSVNSNGDSILVYEEAQWWRAVHEREWLVLTAIKCTRLVPVQYILFKDWQILLCWCTGEHGLACWRKLSWWTIARSCS